MSRSSGSVSRLDGRSSGLVIPVGRGGLTSLLGGYKAERGGLDPGRPIRRVPFRTDRAASVPDGAVSNLGRAVSFYYWAALILSLEQGGLTPGQGGFELGTKRSQLQAGGLEVKRAGLIPRRAIKLVIRVGRGSRPPRFDRFEPAL